MRLATLSGIVPSACGQLQAAARLPRYSDGIATRVNR